MELGVILGLLAVGAALSDRAPFPNLDAPASIHAASFAAGEARSLVIDIDHDTLSLLLDGHALMTHPVARVACGDARETTLGPALTSCLQMSEEARRELASFAPLGTPVRFVSAGQEGAPRDSDHDGIPDAVDILLGGKKVVADAAPYLEHYVRLSFPGG